MPLNINLYKIFLLIFCLCFWISCDDPEDSSDNSIDAPNQDGSPIDYAYDYYSVDGIGYGNTINLPCSIRETDVVDFYTFPEYLIEAYNCSDESIICGDNNVDYDLYVNESLLDETYGGLCSCQCLDDEGFAVDCSSNDAVSRSYSQPAPPSSGACQNSNYDNQSECETNGWIWFESVIDCAVMDANQDCSMDQAEQTDLVNDQSTDFSVSYTNLEKLSWDAEAGRYKTQVSSDQVLEQTVTDESDLYDISNYWTIINQWEDVDGMVYIDHAQWNDTTLLYEEQPIDDEDIDRSWAAHFENDIWGWANNHSALMYGYTQAMYKLWEKYAKLWPDYMLAPDYRFHQRLKGYKCWLSM